MATEAINLTDRARGVYEDQILEAFTTMDALAGDIREILDLLGSPQAAKGVDAAMSLVCTEAIRGMHGRLDGKEVLALRRSGLRRFAGAVRRLDAQRKHRRSRAATAV